LPPHRIYVEVFGGAASVLLAKPPSPIEVYNDVDGSLVNLFETIRNHPVLFLNRIKHLHYSRQLYNAWGPQLATNFKDIDCDRVEAAVRTAYAISSGFIGDPTKGWAFDRSGAKGGSARWNSITERVGYISSRFRDVNIDHLDFRTCIKNWDGSDTLFFLDPPYYNTSGKSYYGFPLEDHVALAEVLPKVKGKWLLTYDDTFWVRHLYQKYQFTKVSSKLNAQKVPRGKSRVNLDQVIITNFKVE
jgi:DNA adenine methylase